MRQQRTVELLFALAVPLPLFGTGGRLQRIHEQAAQPVAAFQIGIHNLKTYFIHARAAQQDLPTDVAYAH